MSGRGRYRRYARKRYMRQKTQGPRADWRGVFAGRSPNPDTLYTTVMQEFTSGELWAAASPGNLYTNQNYIFQNHPTVTAGAYPHAVCVNSPNLQMMYPETTPTFRTRTVNWIDIGRWASFYEYCTIYETNIILEVGNLYSLDAGWNPYGQGEDAYYLYYCLPNVDIPSNLPSIAHNPWTIQSATTPVSTVMRTPKILRKELRYPNTTGQSESLTIRVKWKLKDVGSTNPNYMQKSVSSNTNPAPPGVPTWNEAFDRTGFDTNLAAKRHFFYFWMGTDNTPSQNNVQARWKMKVYAKVKFWQPRYSTIAPTLTFKTGEDEKESPVPDEDWREEMEYDSVPSTPVIEQLTRELHNLNNAKVLSRKV